MPVPGSFVELRCSVLSSAVVSVAVSLHSPSLFSSFSAHWLLHSSPVLLFFLHPWYNLLLSPGFSWAQDLSGCSSCSSLRTITASRISDKHPSGAVLGEGDSLRIILIIPPCPILALSVLKGSLLQNQPIWCVSELQTREVISQFWELFFDGLPSCPELSLT